MPSQNPTAKQLVCRNPFSVLDTLYIVFLLAMLSACQHQPTNKQTATLPQAKPPSAEERTAAMQASNMAKIKQDKFLSALLFSGFEETPPNTQDKNNPEKPSQPAVVESEPAEIEASHLVSVEVWNIILGEEKITLLAKAQKLGATHLPPPNEWHQWKMAMGQLENMGVQENNAKKTILFIAPPDFAKFKNGDHVIVEISSIGGVQIARYVK